MLCVTSQTSLGLQRPATVYGLVNADKNEVMTG